MSNLVEIKKRIASITSIIKVTKVMQMIATAKVAKIKQMMIPMDRYNNLATSILSSYLAHAENKENINKFIQHNKTEDKTQNSPKNAKVLLILLSSDKGTCGSINTNIFKEFISLVKQRQQQGTQVFIYAIGKKARQYLSKHASRLNIQSFREDDFTEAENCNSQVIGQIVSDAINGYVAKDFDRIEIVYHKFKNIITCNAVCEQLLPININNIPSNDMPFVNILESEQTATSVIELFIRTQIYNAYVSNLASIISSRMNAMDNATKNGQEIIDDLRIKYNKSRQAGITAELSDIVSGFEAIS